MSVKRKAPSLTFAEAYHAAQTFLVHIGAAPERLDEPADGIVEFEGNGFVSRLKYDDTPVKQGAILGLLKTTEGRGNTPILFSATSFTGAAEVFGENLNVALFTITSHGDMNPRSPAAHHLMPREQFDAPFVPVVPEEEQDRPAGVWMPGQTGIQDHEWVDCQVCGTTHHPEANFCHRCGASLTRKNRIDPTEPRQRAVYQSSTTPPPLEVRRTGATRAARGRRHDDDLRCRNCGSTDIEVLVE